MQTTKYLALVVAVLAVPAFLVSGDANADTTTQSLNVSSSVVNTCTFSISALTFGAYDPIITNLAADKTGSSTVTYRCTNGDTGVYLGLSQGTGAASGSTDAVPVRTMVGTNTAGALSYNLWSDSGYANLWGNTPATGLALGTAGTTDGGQHSLTVYGKIAQAQTTMKADSYSDVVTATINY